MFDIVKVCLKDDLPLKETQMIKALQVLEKSMPDQVSFFFVLLA